MGNVFKTNEQREHWNAYNNNYAKKNYKAICIKLNLVKDKEVIDYLTKTGKTATTIIKELVAEKLNKLRVENEEQVKKELERIRKEQKARFPDKTDEEIDELILNAFFQAYCENEMSREDLTGLTIAMGYEVVDEVLDKVEKEKKGKKKQ